MRLSKILSLAAVSCLAIGASWARAENSPQYDSWAKHGVGSSVTIKGVTEAAGQKTEMEITQTLLEKSDEKVVVEIKNKMTMMGNTMDTPAQKLEIPAKAPEGQGTPVEEAKKAGFEVKESEENVTIAGKDYAAKVIESTGNQNGMEIVAKVWTSTDVPGMMLKTVSSTTGAMASNTTMEVTAVDAK
ncbi:MAG TPA: hypothetical protein PLD59_12390 [Tepidisphaeraceae bacterium]|mgnify:CR=1 FL=1|nr:hypothetical protein [Tepidisphaeraceae bacterium]